MPLYLSEFILPPEPERSRAFDAIDEAVAQSAGELIELQLAPDSGRFYAIVEHDDVELREVRADELGHRKRAHEDAGLVPSQRIRTLPEDSPDRFAPTLCEPLEQSGLGACGRALPGRR